MTAPEAASSDDVRSDPRGRLEEALGSVDGVAEVLICAAESRDSGLSAEATGYLGERLKEHYREALDAFCEIYRIGEYKQGGDGID